MDALPAELFMLFMPDPDTLGRMLRVCKWISAALTVGGPLKLTDSVDGMNVSNDAATFIVRFNEPPYLICEKIFGTWCTTERYTFERLHQMAGGFPKYMFNTNEIVAFMSGIGWDTIRYRHKFVMESGCDYVGKYNRVFGISDTILVSNTSGAVGDFNSTPIGNKYTGVTMSPSGRHFIYKRVI